MNELRLERNKKAIKQHDEPVYKSRRDFRLAHKTNSLSESEKAPDDYKMNEI